MPHHPDFTFVISELMEVKVDFTRKRTVIVVKTEDRKVLRLEADYNTINKIHDENRNQMTTR